MANTVIALKKSATPSAAPVDLANGELAINYADGKLYYKAANGIIASISGNEPNYFGSVNASGTLIVADTPGDVLTIEAGTNVTITADAINDKITISASGGSGDISPALIQANTARDHANAAFASANAGQATANAAFNKANSATYTSNVVISVADNTNAALRITQTGTSNAILVEDDTNPDSTPFVVDQAGRVGIGTTLPQRSLHVNSTAVVAAILQSTNIANSSLLRFVDPTTSSEGNAPGIGSNGLSLLLLSNATERARIDSSGNVLIGRTDSTVGQNVKLDVNGGINASAILINDQSILSTLNGANAVSVAAFNQANTARIHANAAFLEANTAEAIAIASFEQANTARTHANAAFLSSNSVNTFSSATFVRLTAASQTITGNVNIVGDLTLSGNTFVIDATRLEVDDPLIYLAANNYTSDIVDIGFIANYVNATGQNVHTGLYREHEDKMYYLFQGYDREPINNHLGALSNNMTLAVLNADLRTSNLVLGGANAILTIGAAFDKANSTTYTSNVVISVADNTNAALRITQTGTGDAILVEDDTNPDATPFVVKSNGRVGVGTTTPNTRLMVYGTTGSTADFRITGQNISSFMSSFAIGDTDVVPVMELLKINGVDTARSNVRVGAPLGRINWYGARGNTGDALVYLTGQVEVVTTSEASGGATPGGAMLFKTAAANSGLGPVEVARIDANGRVGIGTTSPGYRLDVRTSALGADGVAVGGPTGFIALHPSTVGGNYNPLVSANDQSIIFYGGSSTAGSGTGNLIIAPWSTSSVGMKIDYNGNVLIGRATSTVGQNVKLDVNGAINASAVLVNGAPLQTTTLTSNVVIAVADNSNAALRITQTGTGDAIRVEDSTNPDATPFVVDANGKVGIGTTFLNNKLTVFTGAEENTDGVLIINGGYGLFAAPRLTFLAFNPLALANDSAIIATAVDGVSPGNMIIGPRTANSASEGGMRIQSSGNVLIGRTNSTVGNNVKLDVNGAINASAVLINGTPALPNTSGVSFNGNLNFPTGNVGIGTATPSSRLEVLGDVPNSLSNLGTGDAATITITNANVGGLNRIAKTLYEIGNLPIASIAGAYTVFNAGGNIGGDLIFSTQSHVGTGVQERMRIDANGNVGVGTTNPQHILDVKGVANVSSALLVNDMNVKPTIQAAFDKANSTTYTSNVVISVTDNTNAALRITQTGTGDAIRVEDSTNPDATPFVVDANGFVCIGATNPSTQLQQFSATAVSRSISTSTIFNLEVVGGGVVSYGPTTNHPLNLVANNATVIRLDTSGNVGIGTTSPAYKLEVNGSFAATTKSFVINHPTKPGMMLRYGSLEGPENGVYVRGRLDGKSIIELPDYWWNLIDESTITVNLTPIGRSQDIWVQSTSAYFIHLNQPADCFFTVFAERKDVDKLVVEY